MSNKVLPQKPDPISCHTINETISLTKCPLLLLLFCNPYLLILKRSLPTRDKRFIAIGVFEVKYQFSTQFCQVNKYQNKYYCSH